MQKIKKKKQYQITFAFLTLGLEGNFFLLAVDLRTPHRAFKSLLKHMYLGYEEIQ